MDKNILSELEQINYIHDSQHDNDGKIFFYKGYEDIITHHIHVVEYKETAWNSYVGFRDYLNNNYEMALKYQDIKLKAEKNCGDDSDKYYYIKAALLKEINLKAKNR